MAGKGFRLDWHPQKLMDVTTARAQRGMENATKFVEAAARSKTKGRIKKSVKSKVRVTRGAVEGYVYTNHFVGRLHETGTQKMRARPFLRPAVFGNGAEIARLIGKG